MKQTIEVEGLPEGWSAKEFRLGEINEPYYDPATKSICRLFLTSTVGVLIVEKIQPRRIVLEEISREEYCRLFHTEIYSMQGSHWKQVKEADIPLTNDEPNVKMGVSQGDGEETMTLTRKDMRGLIEHIKLRGQINPKIAEFIKDK